MTFPFIVTYKKKLKGEIEQFDSAKILAFVKKDFEESGADAVETIDNIVIAKNRLIDIRIRRGLNWNRWIGISEAQYQIYKQDNRRIARYQFNLTRVLVVGLITGLIVGIIIKFFWVGLLVFGVVGILNWLIKLLQHWLIFDGVFMDFIFERNKMNNR